MQARAFFFALIVASAPSWAAVNKTRGVDSNAPIEISADKLEVLQPAQKAIFSGNVVAVQGQVTLTSNQMTVFYRQGATDKANPQGTVSRIEVDQNVHITTPTERGSGDKGAYNVDQKIITLFGNVSLQRDKNLLKGDRLEYNLETGRSLLTAGSGGVTATGSSTGGRVKGTFQPSQKPTAQ